MGMPNQLRIIIIIFYLQKGFSIIAYDCGAPGMNMTTFSLNKIHECNIPIPNPITTAVTIQLLQTAEFATIHVYQCKVEIHRTIYHCGMHAHVSIVSNGDIEYLMEVSQENCRDMHNTHSFRLNDQYHTDIAANSTTSRPIQLSGKVDSTGSCRGGSYSDHYGSWDNVVVIGQIFITINDYYASVKTEKDDLILKSGMHCQYSQCKCMDSDNGNTYWNLIEFSKCNLDGFSLIYQGRAERTRDKSIENYDQEFYSLTSSDYTFALPTKGTLEICGYKLIKTDHPRLFIYDTTQTSPLTKKVGISLKNMDLFTYVNSKFVYLAYHLKTQIVNLYNDVITQQCALERKVLSNTIALATVAPAEFAYHLLKAPGYIAHLAGEVVRIAKCIPVEVKIRKVDQCFQELPVYRGNDSMFLKPTTHILVHTGTQIECNSILIPMFNLNNAWIQAMPQIAPATPPEEIAPLTAKSWKFTDPGNLMDTGVYATDDLSRLSESIMFPIEEPAVLHSIARGATGHQNIYQGVNLENMITFEKIQNKFEEALGVISKIIYTIGHGSTFVLGVFVLFKTIKFIIDTIIHGIALHTVFGWSFVLIGAVWDSVTHFLLHMNKHKKRQKSPNKDDIELGIRNENNTNTPSAPDMAMDQYSRGNKQILSPALLYYPLNEEHSPSVVSVVQEGYNINNLQTLLRNKERINK